jgi:hypothetical protein
MRRVFRDFTDVMQDADIAVVYYAGHGIEVDGSNYLVPTNAALQRDIDVEDETVSLERILKVIEPAKRLRLAILDACRDNPFAKSMKRTMGARSIGRGLATVEPTTSDTLIAFAAKAGSIAEDGNGAHSPFTSALLNHIATPGLDLRIAFGRIRDEVKKITARRQEPFVYGSLGGSTVALVPPTPEPIIASRAEAAIDPNEEARRDYELAERIGTTEMWDSFLLAHSSGFHANLAKAQRLKAMAAERANAKAAADAKAKEDAEIKAAARIAALEAVEKAAPTSLIDPHELARSLQLEIKRVGCFNGAVNGEFDDATKAAWHSFTKLTSISMPDDVSSDAIKAIRGINKRICPLVCPAGKRAEGEECVGSAPKRVTSDAAPSRPAPMPRAHGPAPRGNTKCFGFQGKQFCE